MSRERFEEDCPGCRPAMLDVETGKVLPESHPAMVAMLAIWEGTTRLQREAYHRVMCLNSRDAVDLVIVNAIVNRFTSSQAAVAGTEPESKKGPGKRR